MVLLGGAAVVGVVAYAPGRPQPAPGSQKPAPVNPAITQTRVAALDLARQPGARYLGQLTKADDSRVPVDLTVTSTGTTRGKVGSVTDKFEILVMGGKTFLYANAAFWKDAGADPGRAARYARRWVRIESGYIGIDPEQRLAPSILSAELLRAADAGKTTASPTAKNGVNARPVTIPQGTVYISTDAPYRVVHIDTETTQDVGGGLTPATHAETSEQTSDEASFDLDVSYLSEVVAAGLFVGLKANVARLIDAIDSQVDFDLDGSVALSPCTARRCTAQATLSNELRGSDSYVRTDQPILVEVVIVFTLDGAPIRSCTDVVTMTANGRTTTSCGVSYWLPADGGRHTIQAEVSGFAKAMSKADVAGLSADLVQQTIGWRIRQAGDSGLPDASIRHGRFQFRPPAAYNPMTTRLTETGAGYQDAAGNLWTQAPAKGLASKGGFTREWRVKLSEQGLVRWKAWAKEGVTKHGESKDDWYLNVTPHGDISH